MTGPDGAQEGSMTDQPGEQTPPAKKTAAKKTASRRPAKKAAGAPREKQVAVRLTRKSRGFGVGDELKADESRAAELVESGVAVYVE